MRQSSGRLRQYELELSLQEALLDFGAVGNDLLIPTALGPILASEMRDKLLGAQISNLIT